MKQHVLKRKQIAVKRDHNNIKGREDEVNLKGKLMKH